MIDSDASSGDSSPRDPPGGDRGPQTNHKRKPSGDEIEVIRYPSDQRPQQMANRALHVLGNADRNGTGLYQSGNTADHNGHSWPSERPAQPPAAVNGIRPNTSESQLAEVLQRETNAQDALPKPWEFTTSASGEGSPAGNGLIGPKRKRNFSNRTKTGCMTCRKRKKKCDETHPVCKLISSPSFRAIVTYEY